MMLALYLLFERLSRSARVAGLATVIYTANSNFLFFSAQFSYESLSLPLLVLVLVCVAEREASGLSLRRSWAVPILLGTVAIVVTHHLSSYALVAVLLMLSVASATFPRRPRSRGLLPFALFAIAVTTTWLIVVASTTVGYLEPVLTTTFTSTIHTLSGEAAPRQLFADASGYHAPPIEWAVGIASVLLLAAGVPFGMRAMWRRYRLDPFARVFSVAAVVFFGVLLLRFAPAAWETANRSSEFLFVGLAFVLALVGLERFAPRRAPWLGAALTTLCLAVVFTGGVIAGWQPSLRLSQPYQVDAASRVIEPEGRLLARWAGAQLTPASRFAATQSDSRLLLAYASEYALSGSSPDIQDVLATPTLPPWELALLRGHRLRYVAVDLRKRSTDNMAGYYFGAGRSDKLLTVQIAHKFDRLRADRVYDSGAILVYDLQRELIGPSQR